MIYSASKVQDDINTIIGRVLKLHDITNAKIESILKVQGVSQFHDC